jgi:hypothetical protein
MGARSLRNGLRFLGHGTKGERREASLFGQLDLDLFASNAAT